MSFHSGNLPQSTQICPNSVIIFKFSSESGGRAPQTPHFISFYVYSRRNLGVWLHAQNLRAQKIARFGHFEVRFGQYGWCAPPLKISPYAYGTSMPQISIQVKSLQREHSLKYLGITFDRSLSFNVHVINTVNKAVKGITAVKTMAENTPHPV